MHGSNFRCLPDPFPASSQRGSLIEGTILDQQGYDRFHGKRRTRLSAQARFYMTSGDHRTTITVDNLLFEMMAPRLKLLPEA